MKQKLLGALTFIKKALNKLYCLLPTALPRGMTEFETWADSIITTYDFPNNDSVRFALATMIIHSGPQDDAKPKYQFARAVRASMSKQIAGGVFQDIKTRQIEAQKAEAAKLAEVTAQSAVANVQPIQN